MIADPSDDLCAELVKPFNCIPKLASEVVPLIESNLLGKLPVLDEFYTKVEINVRRFNTLWFLFFSPCLL
jgi:hypothetical protein